MSPSPSHGRIVGNLNLNFPFPSLSRPDCLAAASFGSPRRHRYPAMAKCEQRSSQGDPISRQSPPVPDSRGDRGRDVSGGAPVVRADQWWVRHWVGVGPPPGRISSPSSSAPPERGSHTGPPTYSTATMEGRGSAEAELAEIQARLASLPDKLGTFLQG